MSDPLSRTWEVLADVYDERVRQVARYGTNEDLEDGTGPEVMWAFPLTDSCAKEIESDFRWEYEQHEQTTGKPTWMHLVREEIAEAFLETDPTRLYQELIQVAALAVSWSEKIKSRQKEQEGNV